MNVLFSCNKLCGITAKAFKNKVQYVFLLNVMVKTDENFVLVVLVTRELLDFTMQALRCFREFFFSDWVGI